MTRLEALRQEGRRTLEGIATALPCASPRASSSTRAGREASCTAPSPLGGAAPLAPGDAGTLHALRKSSDGTGCGRRRTRRRTQSTMPRSIRCSPADGSGCCVSTTASPAPGPRSSPCFCHLLVRRCSGRGGWLATSSRWRAIWPSPTSSGRPFFFFF